MTEEKPPMTVREAGRRGGLTTSKRYGYEHYKKAGYKGGKANADRYGHEHFKEIGRKGGRKVAELIKAGKQALAEKEAE
jgi:general stress protein YciG